jgi:hypothetical protein
MQKNFIDTSWHKRKQAGKNGAQPTASARTLLFCKEQAQQWAKTRDPESDP